jgi:F420 biosynthesis protein FbiB-like protein
MSESSSLLYRIIKERRSIRRFDGTSIPPEIVKRILEAATKAPSAHNRQPWRFVILSTFEERHSLASALGQRLREDRLADGDDLDQVERDVARSVERISNAPVVIVACLTMEDMDTYPDERRSRAEYAMAIQSVSMAAQNLLLAASAEGLGACWLCAPLFVQETVNETLDLPAGWEAQGLIITGYPAETGRERARYPVEEVTLWL